MATPQLADIALAAAGAVVALGVLRGYRHGRLATDRAAVLSGEVGLPLEGATTREGVIERLRESGIAAWRASALALAAAALLALGPLGAERTYLVSVLPLVLVVRTCAGAIALTRAATRRPDGLGAAGAPHPSDYLTRTGGLLPLVGLPAAAVVIGLEVGGDGGATALAAAVLLVAVVAAAVQHAAERRIVDTARAAADPLALAWDDVLRARAIAVGRSAVCQLAVIATAIVLPLDSAFLTAAAATAGVLAVRSVYGARPLPPALRPRSLAPLPEQDSEPA